jgi:hypothetical protein
VKRTLLALAAVAILVSAGSASSRLLGPSAVAKQSQLPRRLPPAAPAGEVVLYGHVRSLARTGSRFQLRFDPALWLGGVTANRAAIEDGAIPPGEVVPNDYYIRDEGRRLLTYRVPLTARVEVLTLRTGRIAATRITVSELAQIVRGRNPRRRPLYDRGNHLGFWIRVATDTVRSLDQQYQP